MWLGLSPQHKCFLLNSSNSGISGLGSAYVLANQGVKEVVLYEKEESLGGHAKTVTYPNMMEFFENLGVDMEVSDMSFAVSLDNGKGCEWGSRNGVSGLFAQKKNVLNPYFWQMIREIVRFKEDVLKYIEELEGNPDIDRKETLGEFLNARGYSELFQKAYLVRFFSLMDQSKCYLKFSWTR
ncbi:predicted protein, partial [Arabidopsis lyrata subsp. lyrata]